LSYRGNVLKNSLHFVLYANESYQQKLDTYASTLLWNESLRQDFYKSKLDCKTLKQKFDLHDLKAIDRFDAEALENRHQLLFKIAKIIWA